MDVEGTTTSVSFVHEVLFPYSSKNLRDYINSHFNEPAVQEALVETFDTVFNEKKIALNHNGLIDKLLFWIKEDRKHGALKKLQGLIWHEGYKSGDIKGHAYEDVPGALKSWKENGLEIGIYSSGSVEAQKALFGFSIYGDLNIYISNNFDTSIGPKKEATSYQNILSKIKIEAKEVLFLSDNTEELDAAKKEGINTLQVVRLSEMPFVGHNQIRSFKEIVL